MNLTDLIKAAHSDNGINVTSDVLKRAVQRRLEEREEAAVNACTGIIECFENALKAEVENLRQIRLMEKKKKAEVAKVDKAFRYFAETGIPFPMYEAIGQGRTASRMFCNKIGIAVPDPESELWDVPNGWTPKTSEDTPDPSNV